MWPYNPKCLTSLIALYQSDSKRPCQEKDDAFDRARRSTKQSLYTPKLLVTKWKDTGCGWWTLKHFKDAACMHCVTWCVASKLRRSIRVLQVLGFSLSWWRNFSSPSLFERDQVHIGKKWLNHTGARRPSLTASYRMCELNQWSDLSNRGHCPLSGRTARSFRNMITSNTACWSLWM